jgi:hypothetical protein
MKKSRVEDEHYQASTDSSNDKKSALSLDVKDSGEVSTKREPNTGPISRPSKDGEVTRLDRVPKKSYSKPTLTMYGTDRELSTPQRSKLRWPDPRS